MLTKSEKSLLRKQLFMHLDGIALSSTLNIFNDANFIDLILERNNFTFEHILNVKSGNAGYINIGLRLLTSQGLLTKNNKNYSKTNRGVIYFKHIECFKIISSDLKYLIDIKKSLLNDINSTQIHSKISFLINNKLSRSTNHIEKNIYFNLCGIILGPLLCTIGMAIPHHDLSNIRPFLKMIKSKRVNKQIFDFLCGQQA